MISTCCLRTAHRNESIFSGQSRLEHHLCVLFEGASATCVFCECVKHASVSEPTGKISLAAFACLQDKTRGLNASRIAQLRLQLEEHSQAKYKPDIVYIDASVRHPLGRGPSRAWNIGIRAVEADSTIPSNDKWVAILGAFLHKPSRNQ